MERKDTTFGEDRPEGTRIYHSIHCQVHALDALYEGQQQEISRWITQAKETRDELRDTNWELFLVRQERTILKNKLEACRQELKEAEARAKKSAKKLKKAKRIVIKGPRGEVPAYDPKNPHYELDGYLPKESYSDREIVGTQESMADNFTKAELSRVVNRQDDGYAQELYMLRDEQLSEEKGSTAHRDLHQTQF